MRRIASIFTSLPPGVETHGLFRSGFFSVFEPAQIFAKMKPIFAKNQCDSAFFGRLASPSEEFDESIWLFFKTLKRPGFVFSTAVAKRGLCYYPASLAVTKFAAGCLSFAADQAQLCGKTRWCVDNKCRTMFCRPRINTGQHRKSLD